MKVLQKMILVLSVLFIATNVFCTENKNIGPKAYVEKPDHKFQAVVDGQKIKHDFTIKNKGDALLEIKEVKTT